MITQPLPSPSERNPQLSYYHEPILGDFIYSPSIQSWTHTRRFPDGEEFVLMGRGKQPASEQISIWKRVEENFDQLIAEAKASSSELLTGNEVGLFEPTALVLREVRIEDDLSVIFFFGFPREEEVWMWPMMTFRDFQLVTTEWTV